MSEVGPRLQVTNLNKEYYETRNLEDGDSDSNIHLDGGTDRYGNDIMHGSYDVRCMSEEGAFELNAPSFI